MSEHRSETPVSVLRHVVLFAFKDSSTAEQIQEIEAAFRALPAKIKEIHKFEWGTDVSVVKVLEKLERTQAIFPITCDLTTAKNRSISSNVL